MKVKHTIFKSGIDVCCINLPFFHLLDIFHETIYTAHLPEQRVKAACLNTGSLETFKHCGKTCHPLLTHALCTRTSAVCECVGG